MKTDGRVGEAAMFGCGCWAADAEPSADRRKRLLCFPTVFSMHAACQQLCCNFVSRKSLPEASALVMVSKCWNCTATCSSGDLQIIVAAPEGVRNYHGVPLGLFAALTCDHVCRPAVACSVTGVGEAVMRAGLSRACAEALQVDAAAAAAEADARTSTVDAVCGREIRDCVELGQPAGLPCPHRDCGVLAVRVSRSSGGAGGSGGVDVAGCGALGGNLGSQERSSSMAATAGAADEGGSLDDRIAKCEGGVAGPLSVEGPVQCNAPRSRDNTEATTVSGSLHCQIEEFQREGIEQSIVHVELGAVHNSASMGIAYWGPGMESPVCTILRRQREAAESIGAGMCFMGAQLSWPLGATGQ